MDRADLEQWKPKEVARLLALVETERRYYQEIVANVPVSLLVAGPDLRVVSSNRHFRLSTGRKNDEILNQDLSEVFPIEGALATARQVVQSGLAAAPQQATWITSDKSRDISYTALPLRSWEEDSDTEVLLVIQELIQKETAAAETGLQTLSPKQAKAVALTESIDAMLWEADLSAGLITYVNDYAETLFGYPESAWLENAEIWTDRVFPEDRERISAFYDLMLLSPGKHFSCEFRGLRADGQMIYVRESVRAQRDENGKLVKLYGYTTDISERRQKEEQRATAVKSDALSRLSAKLAHDLNNLLMIIAGYGEELKNSVPSGNPLHTDMREILAATERLYSITTQLQTYTRRPIVSARSTSVPAMLQAVRPAMERALGQRVQLDIEVEGELRKAKIDPEQIEHVLVALAHHAYLELGGEGQVRLRAAQVALTESVGSEGALEAGEYLRLSLSHGGSALSEDARQRLLEPWLYSEEPVRDIKMGLASAYNIVRQSKGDIAVDGWGAHDASAETSRETSRETGGVASSLGTNGTGFHVYLPLLSIAELAAEQATSAPQQAPPPVVEAPAEPVRSLETILIVEDEGGIRALVRKILRRQGYNVLEAANGAEAMAILSQHDGQLDLLLTDVMMPGMNGVELSYKALEKMPALKVLFVSGYTDESLLEAGQFPAGTAFLQKPFTLGSLLGKVREVLDATALRQSAS